MNRQGVAFIGLTAIVSFLLGLVVAGTRPPSPTDALPVPRSATETNPIQISLEHRRHGPCHRQRTGRTSARSPNKINAAVVNVDTASRGGIDAPRPTRRGRR